MPGMFRHTCAIQRTKELLGKVLDRGEKEARITLLDVQQLIIHLEQGSSSFPLLGG